MNTEKLLWIACLVGFFGDAILQVGISNGIGEWGLKDYFPRHGRAESMCIAAGMMTLFYGIYITLKLPLTVPCMALYGVIWDFIFRKTRLFPSLDGYYKHFNYFWSAVWGAIPMMLPLLIYNIMSK